VANASQATAHPAPGADTTLKVLVYSDDRQVRQQVRLALGRRLAADLPALEYVEVATLPVVIQQADSRTCDLLILDGEATPAGGMGWPKTTQTGVGIRRGDFQRYLLPAKE
jgi:hypothetical protein